MDEDKNNINEPKVQPTKENPFKNWNFYTAYFITVIVLFAISWIITGGDGDYWMLSALLLCIPYIITGVISWAIIRFKNRSIALGILFGSITPFVAVFIGTGGCSVF